MYGKVVNIKDTEWDKFINSFRDANLYQTSAFVKYSKGGEKPEKFILYENSNPVASALIRIKTFPFLSKGIAYIRWGPLWRKFDCENNLNILSNILSSLKNEYSIKRNLLLRITSNLVESGNANYSEVFKDHGYTLNQDIDKYRTLILTLNSSNEEIKNNFVKDWRRRLRRGFEKGLQVRFGTSNEYFHIFSRLYHETRSRKSFKEYVSPEMILKVQNELCDENKMNVLICSFDGEDIAAFVIAALGESGLALLAGSSQKGLKLSGSIMLHWNTIEWLKANNFKYYDLGGIDPQNNYSVYRFKKGSGARDINFIGTYENCESYISKYLINTMQKVKKNL